MYRQTDLRIHSGTMARVALPCLGLAPANHDFLLVLFSRGLRARDATEAWLQGMDDRDEAVFGIFQLSPDAPTS
jgi:hypothetical protein